MELLYTLHQARPRGYNIITWIKSFGVLAGFEPGTSGTEVLYSTTIPARSQRIVLENSYLIRKERCHPTEFGVNEPGRD